MFSGIQTPFAGNNVNSVVCKGNMPSKKATPYANGGFVRWNVRTQMPLGARKSFFLAVSYCRQTDELMIKSKTSQTAIKDLINFLFSFLSSFPCYFLSPYRTLLQG